MCAGTTGTTCISVAWHYMSSEAKRYEIPGLRNTEPFLGDFVARYIAKAIEACPVESRLE